MTRSFRPLAALAVCLVSNASLGAAVIEMREADGSVSTMTVEGLKARQQVGEQQYIIMDMAAEKFWSVDQTARHIIDMSAAPEAEVSANAPVQARPQAQAELVRQGKGPLIAGFPTEHYQIVTPSGRICSDTYLSLPALRAAGMSDFMRAFSAFNLKQKAQYQAAGADYEPCEDAHGTAMARYPELGMPLRTVDTDGFLRQEVVRIQAEAPLPKRHFDLPEGFKTLTLEQFLRQDVASDGELEDYLRRQEEAPPAEPSAR